MGPWWILWCIGFCLNRFNSRTALQFNQFWHCFVSIFTILCILWIFAIYVVITQSVIREISQNTSEENTWLGIAAFTIFLQLFMIFLFPFCRDLTCTICKFLLKYPTNFYENFPSPEIFGII